MYRRRRRNDNDRWLERGLKADRRLDRNERRGDNNRGRDHGDGRCDRRNRAKLCLRRIVRKKAEYNYGGECR